MSNPISSGSSVLLLEKLCSGLLSSSGPPPVGQLSIQNLVSPSPLLASLIRAACFIDLAASRREISTQTDSCLLKSKSKAHHHHHLSPILSSLSRHREEREPVRHHKKRKRKKEESKLRKKKKKEKRKVHYCSSPSYSDFEPEDPILRRRLR